MKPTAKQLVDHLRTKYCEVCVYGDVDETKRMYRECRGCPVERAEGAQ